MQQHTRTRSWSRHTTAGYILIEGLVSMVLVAVGILGIAKLQSAIITATADAKATAMAYSVGRAKMEELRNTTIKTQHQGTGCTVGTVVKSGSDTVNITGLETSYSRTWNVTPARNGDNSCDAARHVVSVQVAWSTREESKNIVLRSVIAWNDPLMASATIGTGGTGGGGGPGFNPSAAKFVPDNYLDLDKDVASTVQGKKADGAAVVLSKKGEYVLLVDNKSKIASAVPFVRLSGIVALDQAAATKAQTGILNVVVYRTDITYCIFPLPFTSENNPDTYGLRPTGTPITTSTDAAAAYVCYVPEGWRGNIGLLQQSSNCTSRFNIFDGTTKLDSCNFTDDLACPDGQEGSAFISGVRNIKTLVRNSSGTIIGSSGVMPSHEALDMPNYGPVKQTMRLDFVIFQPADKGKDKTKACSDRFPTAGDSSTGSRVTGITPATFSIFRRAGEWLGLNAAGTGIGVEGVPSLVYTQHALANDASYLRTITGTATNCTKVTASGNYPYGSGTCQITAGTYSCTVSYGWTGTLTATPNPSPIKIDITSPITTLTMPNQNFTCN